MPRKKAVPPGPAAPAVPAVLAEPIQPQPLSELGEPFHEGQCGTCAGYNRARYIADAADLARALAGERIQMGICLTLHKVLVGATKEACARHTEARAAKPVRPAVQPGVDEYVIR